LAVEAKEALRDTEGKEAGEIGVLLLVLTFELMLTEGLALPE